MDLYERIMELGSMGYHCSQIIIIMTLETIGEENPQLGKAMGGPVSYTHLTLRNILQIFFLNRNVFLLKNGHIVSEILRRMVSVRYGLSLIHI